LKSVRTLENDSQQASLLELLADPMLMTALFVDRVYFGTSTF